MQVNYAIFDMDGTLLDSMHVWEDAADTYLKQQGITPPPGLFDKVRELTLPQTAAYFRKLGVQKSIEQIITEARELPYIAYCNTVQPKPGAAELLQTLHQAGVPMCIVSSTDARSIRAVCDRLGWTGYFRFLLSTSDFGSGKDHPEIFYEAARRLGGKPAETVVFEDSLYAVRTAKAAGFPVVGLADELAARDRSAIVQTADLFLPDLRSFPLELPARQPARCCAVVVAAGQSRRMGFSKQEAMLLGVPVLVRTLRAFAEAESIQRVVVVCPLEEEARYRTFLKNWNCLRKVEAVVPGGQTRQQSAAAGARAAGACTLLAIHDGARCLVTPDQIDRVVADAGRYGAAALAVPAKNTIKLADDNGFVQKTLPRAALWEMQTPQVFPAKEYRSLLQAAQGDYTDDCQLFEQAGKPVHLCPGDYTNLKLTTPEDFPMAEAVLRKRG